MLFSLTELKEERHRVEAVRLVSLLLDRGADPNIVGGDYGTALGIAAYEGFEKYVSLLLKRGADVYQVGGKYPTANGDYPTALDAARAGGKCDMDRLLQLGSDRKPWAPFPMP